MTTPAQWRETERAQKKLFKALDMLCDVRDATEDAHSDRTANVNEIAREAIELIQRRTREEGLCQ